MKRSVRTNALFFASFSSIVTSALLNRISSYLLIIIVISGPGLIYSESAHADIQVTDDTGQLFSLDLPAKRIVSLAPNITELLFSAGAGEFVIGIDSYSDYPLQVKKIKKVGSQAGFDLELIVSLKPDLIVAWGSGNSMQTIQKLKSLGLKVFITELGSVDDVATVIQKLGKLSGRNEIASVSAKKFRFDLKNLQRKYLGRSKVRVFYQIWHQPVMTINDKHIISDVIRLCGGVNVFSELMTLAPRVGLEAVLEKNPQVIIASGMAEERPDWIEGWRKWSELDAVMNNNLYFVPPDIIQRHTPRLLMGAKILCEHLDTARNKVGDTSQ